MAPALPQGGFRVLMNVGPAGGQRCIICICILASPRPWRGFANAQRLILNRLRGTTWVVLTHWIILLLVIVLIFGTKNCTNTGRDLGEAVRGFKDMKGEEEKSGQVGKALGIKTINAATKTKPFLN